MRKMMREVPSLYSPPSINGTMPLRPHVCRFCGGRYATYQSVSYHQQHSCPKRPAANGTITPVPVSVVQPMTGNVPEKHRPEIPPSKSEPAPDTDSLSGFGALAPALALVIPAPRAGIPGSPEVGDRIWKVVFWGLVMLLVGWFLYCIFQDYNKQRTAASGTLAPSPARTVQPAVQPAARGPSWSPIPE